MTMNDQPRTTAREVAAFRHCRADRCAFCQALTRLWSKHHEDFGDYVAAHNALHDQKDRAARIHQAYGRKHRR